MGSQIVSVRRRLYYKRGIVDILAGKGEYLLKEKKRLYLARDDKKENIIFIKIGFEKLLNGWQINNYSKDKLWVISFNLREEQFFQSPAKNIPYILKELDRKGIKFRVSRPLPPCIFEEKNTVKKYHIPLNCKDCLELFIVSNDGKNNLFCQHRMDHFLFYRRGRYELVELWKNLLKTERLQKCNTCKIQEKCKFWMWRINCYNHIDDIAIKRKDYPLAINNRKRTQIQKMLASWWFLQNKWKINPDIPVWRKFLRYKLKDEWIIDAGGAYGRNSFGFYKISKKTVLVESEDNFFKYAQQRQKQKQLYFPIVNANVLRLPFKDNSAGLIYSGGVLHTMPQKEKETHLRECYRVLKAGGMFIGTVMAEWEVGKPSNLHAVIYKKDLLYLLKRAGFNLSKVLNKSRVEGEPQQIWHFLAGKSLPNPRRIKPYNLLLDKDRYFLGFNYCTLPLFYKGKLFALYQLQKEKYYILRSLSIKLWDLLSRRDIEGVIFYLRRRPELRRKYIELELENLVNGQFLELYRR